MPWLRRSTRRVQARYCGDGSQPRLQLRGHHDHAALKRAVSHAPFHSRRPGPLRLRRLPRPRRRPTLRVWTALPPAHPGGDTRLTRTRRAPHLPPYGNAPGQRRAGSQRLLRYGPERIPTPARPRRSLRPLPDAPSPLRSRRTTTLSALPPLTTSHQQLPAAVTQNAELYDLVHSEASKSTNVRHRVEDCQPGVPSGGTCRAAQRIRGEHGRRHYACVAMERRHEQREVWWQIAKASVDTLPAGLPGRRRTCWTSPARSPIVGFLIRALSVHCGIRVPNDSSLRS